MALGSLTLKAGRANSCPIREKKNDTFSFFRGNMELLLIEKDTTQHEKLNTVFTNGPKTPKQIQKCLERKKNAFLAITKKKEKEHGC